MGSRKVKCPKIFSLPAFLKHKSSSISGSGLTSSIVRTLAMLFAMSTEIFVRRDSCFAEALGTAMHKGVKKRNAQRCRKRAVKRGVYAKQSCTVSMGW